MELGLTQVRSDFDEEQDTIRLHQMLKLEEIPEDAVITVAILRQGVDRGHCYGRLRVHSPH